LKHGHVTFTIMCINQWYVGTVDGDGMVEVGTA